MNTSHLELQCVRQRTRVVRMLHRSPLRLFQTQCGRGIAEIFSSTYGGGILQGDQTHLAIRCGANTRTVLRSQANTQVYKNQTGKPSIQSIEGRLQEGSLLVLALDPIVLHAGALYHQAQTWRLTEDASLVLLDWFQSGRSESGEQFLFNEYRSEITLMRGESAFVRESFRCHPEWDDPRSPARFAHFNLFMTVYLVGPQSQALARRLAAFKNAQAHVLPLLPARPSHALPQALYGLHPLPGGEGFLFRALACKRIDLEPVVTLIRTYL